MMNILNTELSIVRRSLFYVKFGNKSYSSCMFNFSAGTAESSTFCVSFLTHLVKGFIWLRSFSGHFSRTSFVVSVLKILRVSGTSNYIFKLRFYFVCGFGVNFSFLCRRFQTLFSLLN